MQRRARLSNDDQIYHLLAWDVLFKILQNFRSRFTHDSDNMPYMSTV